MEDKLEIKLVLFKLELSYFCNKEMTLNQIKIDLGMKLGLVSKHYDKMTINFETENQNFSHTLPIKFFINKNIEVKYILDSVPGISQQLILDKTFLPQ
jgi:hypothetical protein